MLQNLSQISVIDFVCSRDVTLLRQVAALCDLTGREEWAEAIRTSIEVSGEPAKQS